MEHDNKRVKILQLKILIAALGILLLLLTLTLFMLAFGEESAERFFARETPASVPTATPFVLTNFDKIRVMITDKETGSIYHSNLDGWQEYVDSESAEAGMVAQNKKASESTEPVATVENPYRGTLEFVATKDGYVVINELPVEEYLYSVVPSEMPASYPLEALKAQAVCARTYAYLHILIPGYPEWNAHVDDTTAYQVYHSVAEQDSTTKAVNETEGMILMAPDGLSPAQTYYYSTSWGYGSDAHVWRTKYSDCYPYIKSKHINKLNSDKVISEEEFEACIKTVNEDDYEASEPWYRWQYQVEQIDSDRMIKVLQQRYAANEKLILTLKGNDFVSQPIRETDRVIDLRIEKREAGGAADELLIITVKNVYKVITEMNIRYVLNDGCSLVKRQDGSDVKMNSLLPSGFFVLENTYERGCISGYKILGGGYGHGAGMSQNAAKAMAMEGMSAEEILDFFFEDCTVKRK